jgi:exopolysaccharide production protein ExoQ
VQSASTSPIGHVSQLVVTWVLMIPLFYFASKGILWFQTPLSNNELSSNYGVLVASGQHLGAITMAPIAVVLFLLFSSKVRSLTKRFFTQHVFAMLAILALVSSLWSQFPMRSLQYAFFMVVNICFALYLFDRFEPRQLLRVLFLFGWIVVLFSIVLSVFFPQYGISHRGDTLGEWNGIFVDKNTCSVVICYLLPVAFYVPLSGFWSRVSRFAYICASLLLIVMSESRTGWIVTAIILVYIGELSLFHSFKRADRMLVIAGSVFVALLIILLGAGHYAMLTYAMGKDPTMSGRTVIFSAAFVSILKHPIIGYGYSAFWNGLVGESANVSLAMHWITPAVDNGYLSIWLELGVVGLFLFIVSLVQAIKNAFFCSRFRNSYYISWCSCILIMAVISNTAERMIMIPNYLPWILYVVVCVSLSEEAKRIRQERAHG